MHDIQITGASRFDPPPPDLIPDRWALKPARLGRMDRLCALALVAADAALVDARVDPGCWQGERIAVVVGTAFGCHATNEAYFRGLLADGPRGASPRLFAYTLPSSPAGEITIHYGARGPVETLVCGRRAGVEAVAWAARVCAAGLADLAIAVAVDVGGGTLLALGHAVTDGAAAIIVERGESARGRDAKLLSQIVGAASAFRLGAPDDAAAAARIQTLDEGGMRSGDPLAIYVRSGVDAVAPVSALADWLHGPQGSRTLASSDDAGGGSALLFTPPMRL